MIKICFSAIMDDQTTRTFFFEQKTVNLKSLVTITNGLNIDSSAQSIEKLLPNFYQHI